MLDVSVDLSGLYQVYSGIIRQFSNNRKSSSISMKTETSQKKSKCKGMKTDKNKTFRCRVS